MKATTWLCPVLTLLCATRLVCTAPRSGIYPLDYADTNMIQDDYLLEKRNKPSLSIVNPLDVLRQRLLLEIARRQMKENTRQVELNRAILKNVGKRMLTIAGPYQAYAQQQQQQQPLQQHLQHLQPRQQMQLLHYPNQLDYIPTASIFDFLESTEKKSPLLDNSEDDSDDIDTAKYAQSGNDMATETTNQNKNSNAGNTLLANSGRRQVALSKSADALNASDNNLLEHEAVYDSDAEHGDGDGADAGNAGYQLRFLQYRQHKNRHLTRK